MLPMEKLNGENNEVKREISKFDEQDNCLINQEDVKIPVLEVLDLSKKHPLSDEAFHQRQNKRNPKNLFVPTEIVTEILSELPVKSLLRFSSVEKSWRALICSPEFIKCHTCLSAKSNKDHIDHEVILRIAQPEVNLNECPVTEESGLDYHMENSGISCVIVGSVNGLICLVNEANELLLWNPTITKCKKLPDFRKKLKDDGHCAYGFGYDEVNDDYKVVCIFSIASCLHNFQEVNVYSLKDDSWRTVHCSRNVTKLIGSGKFVNGQFYWATSINIRSGWSIISFDLINEKWRKVERPYYGEEEEILVLGVLGSNLSMITSNSTTHVDVWAMKECGNKESWSKTFTINYSLYPVDYLFSHSFGFSKRGEFLLMLHDTYIIYNSKDNITTSSKISKFDYGLLTEFFQTLVCPLSQNEGNY